MTVGIFLAGECMDIYDYEDVHVVFENAMYLTKDTGVIHEVRVVHG